LSVCSSALEKSYHKRLSIGVIYLENMQKTYNGALCFSPINAKKTFGKFREHFLNPKGLPNFPKVQYFSLKKNDKNNLHPRFFLLSNGIGWKFKLCFSGVFRVQASVVKVILPESRMHRLPPSFSYRWVNTKQNSL